MSTDYKEVHQVPKKVPLSTSCNSNHQHFHVHIATIKILNHVNYLIYTLMLVCLIKQYKSWKNITWKEFIFQMLSNKRATKKSVWESKSELSSYFRGFPAVLLSGFYLSCVSVPLTVIWIFKSVMRHAIREQSSSANSCLDNNFIILGVVSRWLWFLGGRVRMCFL